MKDINDVIPPIPGMRWGALINSFPTNAKIRYLDKLLPHDQRWHTVFETENSTIVDRVPIVKKSRESMA